MTLNKWFHSQTTQKTASFTENNSISIHFPSNWDEICRLTCELGLLGLANKWRGWGCFVEPQNATFQEKSQRTVTWANAIQVTWRALVTSGNSKQSISSNISILHANQTWTLKKTPTYFMWTLLRTLLKLYTQHISWHIIRTSLWYINSNPIPSMGLVYLPNIYHKNPPFIVVNIPFRPMDGMGLDELLLWVWCCAAGRATLEAILSGSVVGGSCSHRSFHNLLVVPKSSHWKIHLGAHQFFTENLWHNPKFGVFFFSGSLWLAVKWRYGFCGPWFFQKAVFEKRVLIIGFIGIYCWWFRKPG